MGRRGEEGEGLGVAGVGEDAAVIIGVDAVEERVVWGDGERAG